MSFSGTVCSSAAVFDRRDLVKSRLKKAASWKGEKLSVRKYLLIFLFGDEARVDEMWVDQLVAR